MEKIQSDKTGAGFTLIELLVVIAVIGLLASVVMVSLNSARGKARVARAAGDLRQFATILSLYLNDNNAYPCFDHDWDETRETAWATPYARWPKSPWGTQYHWEHQGAYGGQPVIRFSISTVAPLADAQALDKIIDGGNNPASAMIQYAQTGDPVRVEYGGMDQSVSLVDCHI